MSEPIETTPELCSDQLQVSSLTGGCLLKVTIAACCASPLF